jgi:hypothetical protein
MILEISRSIADKITGQGKMMIENTPGWGSNKLNKNKVRQMELYFREQLILIGE